MHEDSIIRFLGIPGHRVGGVHFLDENCSPTEEDGKVDMVVVDMQRTRGPYRCVCGKGFKRCHDYQERFIRDLPWGPWPRVWLLVARFRVNCPDCGVRTEPQDWIAPRCTYTRRLADAVAIACREVRSVRAIAESFDLSWHTVKAIDKAALDKALNPPDLRGVRRLALDEFSIKRRHSYATIFLDLDRNRVLWVCETRKEEAITRVFQDVFGPKVREGIHAVSMDMWAPYEKAVRQCLPNAEIVWDQFHVVKNYNHDVIDRVRIDEANRCQTEAERKALRGTKFLLLRNRENLRDEEPARLAELLRANRRLLAVHVLGEALKHLWDYVYPGCAKRWFEAWYQRAMRSRIEPLKTFARMLKNRFDGIVSHCEHPISNGVLEGINNKVKVIKRVAYGFRDLQYFFLKIRAHYPAIRSH